MKARLALVVIWLLCALAAIVAAKIERLWAAADGYTSGHISGVAIGRLTIGVLQAKPKALVTVASVDDLDFIRPSARDPGLQAGEG